MFYYFYSNINNIILEEIHNNVNISGSLLVDNYLEWCRWDEDSKILKLCFTQELSELEKLELDNIINNLI